MEHSKLKIFTLFVLLFLSSNIRIYSQEEKPITGIFPEKMLVILAEFKNVSIINYDFVVTNPRQTFDRMFNEKDFSYEKATGSVKDYFRENSMGKYNPDFVVVGPVRLPESKSYYGGNIVGGYDKAPGTMVFHACQEVAKAGLVDFSEFDSDKDGFVDNVLVIYSGLSEADGAPAINLWPIAGNLELLNPYEDTEIYPLEIDGVIVDRFIITSELRGKEGENITGIGSPTHELGHILGLPDLYNSVDGNGGLLGWSIMANGPFNNDGKTPPYMNAFEREWLGWGEAEVLTTSGEYTLTDISTNKFYRINTSNPKEYFLLENRQMNGWDSYLGGHGLLIYRIDLSNPEVFTNNIVNADDNHHYVDLIEADGIAHQDNYEGDPFPGSSGKTEFSDETSPSAILWSGDKLNKAITNIKEKDGIISFQFTDYNDNAIYSPDDNIKIYTIGQTLYIETDETNSIAEIYNLQGQMIQSLNILNGRAEINILSKEAVIIRINNKSYKIIL